MLNSKVKSYLSEVVKDENSSVALLFSGGTDSLTCLFSLLELNIKPILYSFHLENTIHKDIEVSKKVATHYNLKHEIIIIKEDIEQLVLDVEFLCKKMKLSRKTNVQCTYPFLHVIPKINEKFVVTGLCADDLYGTSKSMSIKYANNSDGFNTARVKTFSNQYSSAYKPIKELCEMNNKILVAPYRGKEVIDYMMSLNWKQLNSPKQKQIALNSYGDYFNELDVYRRNTNLQVGSKVREWHNELLNTELNFNKRKRVDEIYKDINKGELNELTK